jgi:hypothetical protein
MKGKYIDQFMWGYQHYFRTSIEVSTKSALEAIGFHGSPTVHLVGFKVAGDHKHEICIEPENELYAPHELASVTKLSVDLYEKNPERRILNTDPGVHESRQRHLRDEMRAKALEITLSTLPQSNGRSFISGASVLVGDYEVHVVIGIDRAALDSCPQIKTTERDRFRVHPSLVHAVIRQLLERSARALYIPNVGMGALVESTDEVVRGATQAMVTSLLYCAGFWFGSDSHLSMSTLSALPYEGRAGSGRLVIAKKGHPDVEALIKLQQPVNMRNMTAVRKLLEASGIEADLLSDGESVYGLGLVSQNYDAESETIFVASVTGRGVWQLSHAGQALITVQDGVPHLPTHVLDEKYLGDLIDRFFPDADAHALRAVARAVGNHAHGAMLIISEDAEAEANRLSPQAWSVEPANLTHELFTQLTGMDGAVLIDVQGRCHAIGVILDGTAHGNGNPARGSRFNNAIRYLDSEPPTAIVIVYSSDGPIDILPHLHPRIEKHIVSDAVELYLKISRAEPLILKDVSRAWSRVSSLRFYLSTSQCDALNEAHGRVERWRKENTSIWPIESDLKPDSAMNESYWL